METVPGRGDGRVLDTTAPALCEGEPKRGALDRLSLGASTNRAVNESWHRPARDGAWALDQIRDAGSLPGAALPAFVGRVDANIGVSRKTFDTQMG